MSAQHIYHTALPLSPETSALRLRFLESRSSWEEDWTTRYASSSSIPATWGPILRTIKDDSGRFTHVTVAGQGIIAICEDNTVNVYDGVTGVLKISLNAPQQVTSVEGSPDGSLLFFLHELACEITVWDTQTEVTVWDTQTGGLIHTLTTTFEISNIAVSLKGKYIAGRSSNSPSFRFWEVESRRENSRLLDQVVSDICWLEPEDQVALGLEKAVLILDVATGRKLRAIHIGGSAKGIAFSAGRRQLAIRTMDKIMTTGIQTGPLSTSSSLIGLTCFAFSTNGDRIICATDTGDLRHLNISTHPFSWSDNLNRLGTIDSINLLRSGHLVAKVGGSIHILEKEYTRLPSISVDSGATRVYQFYNDEAICASFRDNRDVNLLDMETMQTLFDYHTPPDERHDSLILRFLCASIDHRIALLYLFKSYSFVLRLYTIGGDGYRWETRPFDDVLLGAISPDGEKLVTVSGSRRSAWSESWEFYVLKASSGRILASFTIPFVQGVELPRSIAFTSETQFYTVTEDHRVFSAPPPNEDEGDSENNHDQTTLTTSTTSKRPPLRPYVQMPDDVSISTTDSESPPRTEVRYKECCVRKTFSLRAGWFHLEIKEMPGEEILPAPPAHSYALDDNLEWVVDAKSRRVCWLPPGYISGIKDGHFVVGSSIVMAGQDGTVRRLTFRKPGSDS
jgi:hypothetical protein